jgi:hypothetical protein
MTSDEAQLQLLEISLFSQGSFDGINRPMWCDDKSSEANVLQLVPEIKVP